MIQKKSWNQFREAGLLWWANRLLHTFGWAIVFQIEDDGELSDVYPARVKFRGFGDQSEENGFRQLSEYMVNNAAELKEEADQ